VLSRLKKLPFENSKETLPENTGKLHKYFELCEFSASDLRLRTDIKYLAAFLVSQPEGSSSGRALRKRNIDQSLPPSQQLAQSAIIVTVW
jgi:hypothetical protein